MTTEERILIAEFMGWQSGKFEHLPMKLHKTVHGRELSIHVSQLQYNTEWNMLMPVWVKIQSMENGRFQFTVDPWSATLIDYKESEKEIFAHEFDLEYTPFQKYYEPALQFIQWYNTQPK